MACRSAHEARFAPTMVSSAALIGSRDALSRMRARYRRFRTIRFRDRERMAHDVSPTARALLALEMIQNHPGITADRLGERLGVSERAARRYVAILREADLPIESVSGPHGGYRVGRGLRLPPLMFTAAEAMGLVMAVLEGHRNAADPADLVGAALAKIVRVLPERVAGPARAFREASASPLADAAPASPDRKSTRLNS